MGQFFPAGRPTGISRPGYLDSRRPVFVVPSSWLTEFINIVFNKGRTDCVEVIVREEPDDLLYCSFPDYFHISTV